MRISEALKLIFPRLSALGFDIEQKPLRRKPVRYDYQLKIPSPCLLHNDNMNLFFSVYQDDMYECRCMVYPHVLIYPYQLGVNAEPNKYYLQIDKTPAHLLKDGTDANYVFAEGRESTQSDIPGILVEYIDIDKLAQLAEAVLKEVASIEQMLSLDSIKSAEDALSQVLNQE